MLPVAALLGDARRALHMNQKDFGERLGSSYRTAGRWERAEAYPTPTQVHEVARLVYEKDPALAAALAEAVETTIEALGIGAPTREEELGIDSVVFAASEALDLSPRLVRRGVLAAFARAETLELSVAQVTAALRARNAKRKKRSKKPQPTL